MLYVAVAALVVIIDQISKRVVWETMQDRLPIELIGGFLRLRLSTNTGAVMGILSGSRILLIIVTVASIAALVFFAYRMRYAPLLKRVCLSLILGGAFGNLIDRISTGKVIDFIDMGIGAYRWPTYNVADIAVTFGALVLIAGFLTGPESARD